MIKKIITLLVILVSTIAHAQDIREYCYHLNETSYKEVKLRKTYFLKEINNTKESNENIEKIINDCFTKTKKGSDPNWAKCPLFYSVKNETEAETLVTVEYAYEEKYQTSTKVKKEKDQKPNLPFYYTLHNNDLSCTAIVKYEYQDGSKPSTDTIIVSVHKEDAELEKLKSLDTLALGLEESFSRKMAYLNQAKTYMKVRISFPKVKPKGKDLKLEYETFQVLLKDKKYLEAGKLMKKIHEGTQTPESALCLSFCYELVGNYPEAIKYSKQKPDFKTKVRQKKEMLLLDYATDLGEAPILIEL